MTTTKKYHPKFDMETPRRIGTSKKRKKPTAPQNKMTSEAIIQRAHLRRVLQQSATNKTNAESVVTPMLGSRRHILPFLSEEERALLRDLTLALKENTAQMRNAQDPNWAEPPEKEAPAEAAEATEALPSPA